MCSGVWAPLHKMIQGWTIFNPPQLSEMCHFMFCVIGVLYSKQFTGGGRNLGKSSNETKAYCTVQSWSLKIYLTDSMFKDQQNAQGTLSHLDLWNCRCFCPLFYLARVCVRWRTDWLSTSINFTISIKCENVLYRISKVIAFSIHHIHYIVIVYIITQYYINDFADFALFWT